MQIYIVCVASFFIRKTYYSMVFVERIFLMVSLCVVSIFVNHILLSLFCFSHFDGIWFSSFNELDGISPSKDEFLDAMEPKLNSAIIWVWFCFLTSYTYVSLYSGIRSWKFFIVICMLICSNYTYRVEDNGYKACGWSNYYFCNIKLLFW